MKPANPFNFALAVICSIALLTGCSKPASDKPADPPEKADTPKTAGVTLDAETQARIGLKMETPAVTQWQPQLRAAGRVVDPLVFTAAAADYETSRGALAVSGGELARTQKLAEQNNTSARALETAQSAATHEALALKSARAKFTGDWGVHLAARTDRKSVV